MNPVTVVLIDRPDAVTVTSAPPEGLESFLSAAVAVVCCALLLYKAALVTRLNINWDEFFFLSFVHSLTRGDLNLVLQGAFTHLFAWLPGAAATEDEQIVVARLLMVGLLALTAFLIWRLSKSWLNGLAATAPVLVYLTLVPVTVHGGSFRADSMLAPLLMGALVLVAADPTRIRQQVTAGLLLGLALALTIKAALFAPLVALFIFFRIREHSAAVGQTGALPPWVRATGITGFVAIGSFALLVAIHSWSLSPLTEVVHSAIASESAQAFALRTLLTTVVETPWFPMRHVLWIYVDWQPLIWLLIVIGWFVTTFRRLGSATSLGLALLPLVFYRNSFPYFYVVMMAPASVLAGFAIQFLSSYLMQRRTTFTAGSFSTILVLGLVLLPFANLARLWPDRQTIQRDIIAGVHQIFPDRTSYFDRCGMIASYSKANFFMSTWGLASYREKGKPVMRDAAEQARTAFVLVNAPALMTGRPSPYGLLEADREFLEQTYSRYWGPVKVAGGTAALGPTLTIGKLHVPFAAQYRLVSPVPLVWDARLLQPNDVIAVKDAITVRLPEGTSLQEPIRVKLVLATARPAPAYEPPDIEIFTGL